MSEIVKVEFYGGELEAIHRDERVWVSVRRCCESLGIDVEGQRKKLKEKSWARTELMSVRDSAGRKQDAFMIDLDSFPMWLANIHETKVREEIRPLLVKYQLEAARVLRDHFFGSDKLVDINALSRRALAEMVIAAEDEADRAKAEVKKLMPYADAGKAMYVEHGYYKIGVFAKMVLVDGKAIGEKKLFEWLRKKGILLSSDLNWNDPAQVHINNGRFRLKRGTYKDGYGNDKPCRTTLITPKGMGYVANRLKGDADFERVAIDIDGLSDMGIEIQ